MSRYYTRTAALTEKVMCPNQVNQFTGQRAEELRSQAVLLLKKEHGLCRLRLKPDEERENEKLETLKAEEEVIVK
jgi:hypothetical protein